VLSHSQPKASQTGQSRHLLNRTPEKAFHLFDPPAGSLDLPFQIVKVVNQLAHNESMVVSETPIESKAKLWDFSSRLSFGKLGRLNSVLQSNVTLREKGAPQQPTANNRPYAGFAPHLKPQATAPFSLPLFVLIARLNLLDVLDMLAELCALIGAG